MLFSFKKSELFYEYLTLFNLEVWAIIKGKLLKKLNFINLHCRNGAWVICEPWFTGSRDLCELWKYVNHKSKFTEKSCEPGLQKFGSQKSGSQKSGSQKFGSCTIF